MDFSQFKAGETPKQRFVVMVSNIDYSKKIKYSDIVNKVTIFKHEAKVFHKIYPKDSCWLDVIRFIERLNVNEECVFYYETHSISILNEKNSTILPYNENTYFTEGEYLFMNNFQKYF